MQHEHAKLDQTAVVLLVDDDPGDQELTRRSLSHSSLKVDLRIVGDGEQAIEYLFRRGEFEDAQTSPRPDLVLLDLNMPKKNGREVLAEIQQDKELSRIPVVVLTTSQQEADILRSYDLGCNSYIQKPVDLDQFVDSVRKLGSYWLQVVTLPSGESVNSIAGSHQ